MVGVVILTAALLMLAVEQVSPGRNWSKVRGWWPRAIALNLFQAGAVYILAPIWDKWFDGRSLWSASDHFGTWGGAAFGYLVVTFIYYWWHRWRHEVQFLWQYFHQIHHSPQRLEVITSFYKHPLEISFNSLLSSFILVVLCGLNAEATLIAVLFTGVAELFYHWNVKTPYWLGFFFQRPESHCVHHKKDWHRQNFSDLPLWDMLFGTFHNPKEFEAECGFENDGERKLVAMIAGKDIHLEMKKP